MGENVGARMLLFVAYLAAAVGYGSWVASRTVFDTAATKHAATQLLAQPAVQRSLTEDLSEQVDKELADRNASADVRAAVSGAIQDPRVVAAFAEAIAQVHKAVLGERSADGKVVLDSRALMVAVTEGLQKYDPALAAEVQRNAQERPLVVEIGGDDLPSLAATRDRANSFVLLGVGLGLLLAAWSLLMLHDRKHFRRLGKRIAYLSAVPLLMFVLGPWVLAKFDSDGPQIASAVLRTYAGRVVPSALFLLVVGATVIITTILWPKPKLVVSAPVPTPPTEEIPNPMAPALNPRDPTVTDKLYL
jgi:hypothetical protein